jgi:hypothetical protein
MNFGAVILDWIDQQKRKTQSRYGYTTPHMQREREREITTKFQHGQVNKSLPSKRN